MGQPPAAALVALFLTGALMVAALGAARSNPREPIRLPPRYAPARPISAQAV